MSIDECCRSRTTGAIGGTGARGTSDRILQITEFTFEMTALLIMAPKHKTQSVFTSKPNTSFKCLSNKTLDSYFKPKCL